MYFVASPSNKVSEIIFSYCLWLLAYCLNYFQMMEIDDNEWLKHEFICLVSSFLDLIDVASRFGISKWLVVQLYLWYSVNVDTLVFFSFLATALWSESYKLFQKSRLKLSLSWFICSIEDEFQMVVSDSAPSIALCRFLFRKLSIGKFNLQVSFSLGLFVSDKNIWNALSLSFTYLGASWLQAHKPANLHQDQ